MIALVVLVVVAFYLAAYLIYGKFLSKKFCLDDSRKTPACEINDGVDFVPAKASFLLGQHFSAISAAGPIVGPVLGCIWFGWLPAVLWIMLGAVFIGGVHDFSSIIASIRHGATSVGELVKRYMNPSAYILFLIFIWITLLYIIIAFTDITAQTFKTVTAGNAFGPGVAVTSFLYLVSAIVMGLLIRFFKMKVWVATLIFLPLVFFFVWFGPRSPEWLISVFAAISVKQWDAILLGYCFIASIIPMWLLLQPRGYLGGWMLYMVIAASFIGVFFGGYSVEYPALNLEGLKSLANGKALFPVLFITIACGACSGFHGIVGSGTTSKQIAKESDVKVVGYGAMLLEGIVAIFALATVMMLSKEDALLKSDPNLIYANGIAKFLGLIGVDFNFALAFALLAFSTFVYDTLDVCTRLARYVLQELLGVKGILGAMIATAGSLVFPLVFLFAADEKGYLIAWPIFGTSNQLLASLILLMISVWLIKTGKNAIFTILPMIFMMVMTLWSLILFIKPLVLAMPVIGNGSALASGVILSGTVSVILLILTVWLVIEVVRQLTSSSRSRQVC